MYDCKNGISYLVLWYSLFWDVTQCNVPVGRRPHLHHSGSLKSIWSNLVHTLWLSQKATGGKTARNVYIARTSGHCGNYHIESAVTCPTLGMHLRCMNSHRNPTSTRLFAVGKHNFLTKFRMYIGISEGICKVVNFMRAHKVLVLKNNVQQYRNWLGLSYQSIPIQGKDRDGLIKRTRGQSPTITAPSNRMNL